MTTEEQQQLLDAEHLRLLRLGYIISGVANAAWALFPLIHITMGILMLTGAFPGGGKADSDLRWGGLLFVIMGAAFSAIFATAAVLKLLTARAIRERRSKMLCMVTAALSCIGIPYGTALGVFTFLVFARPSVAAMFHSKLNGSPAVAG